MMNTDTLKQGSPNQDTYNIATLQRDIAISYNFN